MFAQNGSYTTGELGYYPRRLADADLVGFAATSGPALMTVAGAKAPVYCTNPIAFAAPLDEGPPLLIDQASSATAFVQLRHYAEQDEPLPAGWAVDVRMNGVEVRLRPNGLAGLVRDVAGSRRAAA